LIIAKICNTHQQKRKSQPNTSAIKIKLKQSSSEVPDSAKENKQNKQNKREKYKKLRKKKKKRTYYHLHGKKASDAMTKETRTGTAEAQTPKTKKLKQRNRKKKQRKRKRNHPKNRGALCVSVGAYYKH